MAVFPDRIVLKNSTDAEAAIITAIESGGTDEIAQGEIVLGINTTDVKFYTKAGDGSIVTLGGTASGATSLNDLSDVTYSGGSLQIDGLGTIRFAQDVPAGETWRIYDQSTYGLGLSATVDATGDGSFIFAHPTKGVEIKMEEAAVFNISGPFNTTTNTPEIRLNSGNPTDSTPTGNYFGLTLPAGYNTDQTYTVPATDGTSGQVLSTDGAGALSWVSNAGGGGASALNDLSDVSYTSGSFEPTALDQVVFSSADVPGTDTWKVYANSLYGAALGAYETSSVDGSFVYAHPTKGIELRTHASVVNISGDTSLTTNTPELRLNTGNPTASTPTGNYFGLKLPAGYNTDQTYTVPATDGTSGQVLSTDGAGVLSWANNAGGGGATELNDLTDVSTVQMDTYRYAWSGTNGSATDPGTGNYSIPPNYNYLQINDIDQDGKDVSPILNAIDGLTGQTAYLSSDGGSSWWSVPLSLFSATNSDNGTYWAFIRSGDGGWSEAQDNSQMSDPEILFSLEDPNDQSTWSGQAQDDQILRYNSTSSLWEATDLNLTEADISPTLPTVTGTFIDSDSTAATSQVLTAPTHNEDDLLVAVLMVRSTSGTITPPSGWVLHGTYLSSIDINGTIQELNVYTKTATASEPASYTWTQASSSRICGYIAAIGGGVLITGVTENYGNATTATITTAADQLNLTAATWVYSGAGATYSQSGAGVTEITDSPTADARISGGYTFSAATVTSTHSSTGTDFNPNHGMINIVLEVPTSISDKTDVDTVTTPPTDGQMLTWVDANNKWEPGFGALRELTDTDIPAPAAGPIFFTSFNSGQATFTDPAASATGGSIDTSLGTNAWKVLSTDYYGDGSKLEGALDTDARYDVVNFRVRSSQAFDTNNRVSLGGNKQEIDAGGGFTIYTRATGFGFYAAGAFQEVGTLPTMNADTWYEITWVLDWGSVQRANMPAFSLWVDGAIAVNNVTPTASYLELTGAEANNFRLMWNSTAQTNSGDKFYDDFRIRTASTLPWGMTDATITDPAGQMDTEYGSGSNITDGNVLTWNNTSRAWVPDSLQGAAIRTALGIGEYADDTAAGTGGVASGALYYNTTSSDYRLKS